MKQNDEFQADIWNKRVISKTVIIVESVISAAAVIELASTFVHLRMTNPKAVLSTKDSTAEFE